MKIISNELKINLQFLKFCHIYFTCQDIVSSVGLGPTPVIFDGALSGTIKRNRKVLLAETKLIFTKLKFNEHRLAEKHYIYKHY